MSGSLLEVLVLVASVPITIIVNVSVVVIFVSWMATFARVIFSAMTFMYIFVLPCIAVRGPVAVFRSNDDSECKIDNALCSPELKRIKDIVRPVRVGLVDIICAVSKTRLHRRQAGQESRFAKFTTQINNNFHIILESDHASRHIVHRGKGIFW